jgi:hypothetical protein
VARRRVEAYQKRPAEELYNVSEDPWQFENLVESSGQAERRATLRGLLEAWMDEMGDTRTTFGQPTLIQTHAAVKSAEPK